jgi:hypothetical protein
LIVAKLTGESDSHEVSREFADVAHAIQWLQGAGLADFDDQTAHGEVSKDGEIVWAKSRLQTSESRARNEKRDATRLLASLNLTDRRGRL